MKKPSIRILLLVVALLPALLPALRAADGRFQKEGPHLNPIITSGQSSLSLLFGVKKASEDATDPPAYSQRAKLSAPRPSSSTRSERARRLSASLNVQEIIIETSPGAPYTIVSSHDDERMMVEFLPRLIPRVIVRSIHSAHVSTPELEHAPFIAAVLGEGEPAASVKIALAALPILPPPAFASPVPGKPGCVYPPGGLRIPANIVDVTGLESGTRARDPITKIIFLVP